MLLIFLVTATHQTLGEGVGEGVSWVCQIPTAMLQQAEAALRQQEGLVEFPVLMLNLVTPAPSIKAAMRVLSVMLLAGQGGEEASTGEEAVLILIMR